MSEWIEIKKEDIDVDSITREVQILFESNENGNRYVFFKIEDIKELLEAVDNSPTSKQN